MATPMLGSGMRRIKARFGLLLPPVWLIVIASLLAYSTSDARTPYTPTKGKVTQGLTTDPIAISQK
jgi:hypothetical protein